MLPVQSVRDVPGRSAPLFSGELADEYIQLILRSSNSGSRAVFIFHRDLKSKDEVFRKMYDALKAPNFSRGTGITHAKFLCLLSALQNVAASEAQKNALRQNNHRMMEDAYYKSIVESLSI